MTDMKTTRIPTWTALFALFPLSLSLAVIQPPAPAHASTDGVAEVRFLDSINTERASRGIHRLRVANDLRDVARRHSIRMADTNTLHHNRNLGGEVQSWLRLRENIGRGPSVGSLHRAFMESAEHRRNLLDEDVTEIGVGVEVRGSTIWVTQIYRKPTTEPTVAFSDVRASSVHRQDIERLARSGITLGCGSDRYCPDRHVTRAEMGTLIARSAALMPRNPHSFTDTSTTPVHAANIEAIHTDGITRGCGASIYCPSRSVTRAEMASLLARARGLPIRTTETRYSDVTPSSTHAGAIEALAQAGITNGCGSGRYCPGRSVTRAEMASFLVRAFGL